jgi:hypothetical protein
MVPLLTRGVVGCQGDRDHCVTGKGDMTPGQLNRPTVCLTDPGRIDLQRILLQRCFRSTSSKPAGFYILLHYLP